MQEAQLTLVIGEALGRAALVDIRLEVVVQVVLEELVVASHGSQGRVGARVLAEAKVIGILAGDTGQRVVQTDDAAVGARLVIQNDFRRAAL